MNEIITLLVDMRNFKVACVLLQAAYGYRSDVLYELGFHTSTWETTPVSTLGPISRTKDEWKRFAELCNAKHDPKHEQEYTTDRHELVEFA